MNKHSLICGIVSVLVMIGAYTLLSRYQHQIDPDDTTVPSWSQLKEGVILMVNEHPRSRERWLLEDSKATLTRLFLGLFFGVTGAVILGFAMGVNKTIEALLGPPLALVAKIPPTAALAVFFVMVGTDTSMFVAMIAFGVLPVLAQSIHLAIREVPEELRYKALTLGASRMEVILDVIFRLVFPRMLDAFRLQIGPAMVYLIAAEMVTSDVGFGYRIRLQSRLLNMSVVYPYLMALAAFGFSLDILLRSIQRRTCPWYVGKGD